jgi:hypothetical protein
MTLPAELAALRDEAMRVSCQSWAIMKRWPLSKGNEMVGPCPKCGGTDRFSINVRENLFNCRRCEKGGEGVIALVMWSEDKSFVQACELITGRSAAEPVDEARQERLEREAVEEKARRAAAQAEYRERARIDAYAIWRRARPAPAGGIVATYLAEFRGLGRAGSTLNFSGDFGAALHIRWLPEHPYWEDRQVIHRGPAMILPIVAPDGRFMGVHQTWIDLDQPKGKASLPPDARGRPRPVKKVRGLMKGGAIRLVTPEKPRRLVMGEGIETTLTPYAYAAEPDTAYWAGVAIGNMAGRAAHRHEGGWVFDQPDLEDGECFVPPAWCAELVFLRELDEPEKRTTEKIARGLRRAEAMVPGLAGFFADPGAGAKDLNDLVLPGR